MENKIGLIARLVKKQTNRIYFSEIPVGTRFIIVEEHTNMPAYDLTGYFLNHPPQKLMDGKFSFTGYVEKGTWELVGPIDKIIWELRLVEPTLDDLQKEHPYQKMNEIISVQKNEYGFYDVEVDVEVNLGISKIKHAKLTFPYPLKKYEDLPHLDKMKWRCGNFSALPQNSEIFHPPTEPIMEDSVKNILQEWAKKVEQTQSGTSTNVNDDLKIRFKYFTGDNLESNPQEHQSFKNNLESLNKEEIVEVIYKFFTKTDTQTTNEENAPVEKYMVREFAGVKRTLLNYLKIIVRHKAISKEH